MSEIDKIDAVLIAKPGETIVVKTTRDARPDDVQEIARQMQERVSDGVRVLVIGGVIDSISVHADDEAERIADAVRKATENPGKTYEAGQ